MVNFYKTVDGKLIQIDEIEKDAWINVAEPNEEEISFLSEALSLNPEFIRAALDEEEMSHIETEDDQTLIVIDIPVAENEQSAIIYSTMPLGVIVTKDNIVTICLKDSSIIREFTEGSVRDLNTQMKTRFIFQLFFKVATRFLQYLRQIDKISRLVEKQLHASMKNKELIQLLDLEKSLVYFTTSLRANEATFEKLYRGKVVKIYEDDQDLLEDVLIEIKQAIEMANIYSNILSGTMDAFASLISNNLNIVMKLLASITIVISVPTIITGFYGMNVGNLPWNNTFVAPLLMSIILSGITAYILYKKNMF